MRVGEDGSRGRAARACAARARRFAEALRTAGSASRVGARDGARGEGRETSGLRAAALRVVDGKGGELALRRRGSREEEVRPETPPSSRPAPRLALPSAVPELRALARALPLAIGAARVKDGAPLALSLGRSLDVELRAAPAGVEIVLRPEARLLRAAEAELPRVVAALRARGIAVARARVRGRAAGSGASAARVDVSAPLR